MASITVCDLADRVLSSILDADCAAIVQKPLEANGIQFMFFDLMKKKATSFAFSSENRRKKFGGVV